MSQRVRFEVEGGVADVRLDRADKMNALDPEMFRALVATGRELGARGDVRAIVLSGEGRAFCAGLDFGSFAAMAGGSSGESAEEAPTGSSRFFEGGVGAANFAQSAAWIWHEVPVPVIAAVHGVAFGGGLQIALGADLRIVHPAAKLSVMEIKWGLVPDMSGPQRLRELVRDDVARELTFTGRVVTGEEAVGLGLATRTSDDPLADALALAGEIAAKSPHAIRAAKKLLNEVAEVDRGDGLRLEESLQRGLLGSPNQVEAVTANFEKREPRFADVEG